MITTEITEDEYNRLWATNVAGTFNFSKRLAPLINEGGRSTDASPQPAVLSCCTARHEQRRGCTCGLLSANAFTGNTCQLSRTLSTHQNYSPALPPAPLI